MRVTTSVLVGGAAEYPEVAQDFVGLRAIVAQADPYPVLTEAFEALGLDWQVPHVSTHPPTAFLLVAPLAFMPLSLGISAWAWLMVALLFSSLTSYGLSRTMALGLVPVLLLWPPMAFSLTQITIVWMWGLAVGYRLGRSRPFLGGCGVAVASLTKFWPGLVLLAFLARKQWSAVLGFTAVWIAAGTFLAGLEPTSVTAFLRANRTNALDTVLRADNSSLPVNVYRVAGVGGLTLAVFFLVCLLAANRRVFRRPGRTDFIALWMLLSFLSVALLPVSWIYSLAPLAPVILYLLSKRDALAMSAAAFALVIPCITQPWGAITALPLGESVAAVGIGLIAVGLSQDQLAPVATSSSEQILPL